MGKSPAQIENAVDDLADAVEVLVKTGAPQPAHDAIEAFRKKWKAADASETVTKPTGPSPSDLQSQIDELSRQQGSLEQQLGQLQSSQRATKAPTPPPVVSSPPVMSSPPPEPPIVSTV